VQTTNGVPPSTGQQWCTRTLTPPPLWLLDADDKEDLVERGGLARVELVERGDLAGANLNLVRASGQ
jgi:hypothetical protein